MNTTKKIVVALAVMMVAAAMAAPAVMGDVGYEAKVVKGQNTVLYMINGSFGDVKSPSLDNPIPKSFNLTNSGNWPAKVNATFNTSFGGVYGLINTTKNATIGGSNFTISEPSMGGQNAYNTTLLNTFTEVTLNNTVPWGSLNHTYGALLDVPGEIPVGSYSGKVKLIFMDK